MKGRFPLCPKKGVWNFQALKTPAFIQAGEFQTPFFGQSSSFPSFHQYWYMICTSSNQENGLAESWSRRLVGQVLGRLDVQLRTSGVTKRIAQTCGYLSTCITRSFRFSAHSGDEVSPAPVRPGRSVKQDSRRRLQRQPRQHDCTITA